MNQMHNITVARYANPAPAGGYPPDADVIAQHAIHGEQRRRANDDIDGGGMLAFLRDGGVIGAYQAPPAPVLTSTDYAAAVQEHIDDTARSRQYADGYAIASYVTSGNASWAAEAQAFVAWRDDVWTACYQTLASVQQGQQPPPTIAELIASLPAIQWAQTREQNVGV